MSVHSITVGFSPILYSCLYVATLGNTFKYNVELLSLQPMFPPKYFEYFPPEGGCSEVLDAFSFVLNIIPRTPTTYIQSGEGTTEIHIYIHREEENTATRDREPLHTMYAPQFSTCTLACLSY